MRISAYLGALIILITFSRCETEIDITADYEKIPVVYGLLDPSVEKQIFMINRTFLGNVNALEVVAIEDSMLYENVDAKLEWYNENGSLLGSVTLEEEQIENKDVNGIFYSPTATVYTVNSVDIWSDWANWGNQTMTQENNAANYLYKLNILADGEVITAETAMASTNGNGNGAIEQPVHGFDTGLQLVNTFNPNGSSYNPNFSIVWNAGNNDVRNAIRQDLKIQFNYTEFYTDGSPEQQKNVSFLYHSEQIDIDGSEISESTNGERIIQRIADGMSELETPDNLQYRRIDNMDFILIVAGTDLTTYLNIGDNQVSEVGQNRPTFSNINDGDGIGIFSSRDVYVRTKPIFGPNQSNSATLNELVNGQYTQNLCLCGGDGSSPDLNCSNEANWCQ